MPEVSQVHIDVALTNVSIAYRNPDYISDIIAPPVPVRKQSDKYFIFDPERERFRESNDRRAPGAEASEVGFGLSTDNYYCEDHALETAIPDEERENADPPIQVDIDRTEFLVDKILLNKEIALAESNGFIIVSLGWISAAIFGALPFYFNGVFDGNFINCVFETMSGFTTTGATVLTNIEIVPKGLLFWRSLTHWLGGMGIILLAIIILPALGSSSTQLFRAEVPGPTKDKISPKVKNTAMILWLIYIGLTVMETIMLMPLYQMAWKR